MIKLNLLDFNRESGKGKRKNLAASG